MKKNRIIAVLMALTLMVAALAGCGSTTSNTDPAPDASDDQTVVTEQTQTEKALALINTFATGDTETARSLLADGYIQHNLAYGTGADAFKSVFSIRALSLQVPQLSKTVF